MLVRPKKLQIDPANPFAFDKLHRQESATILTQLLQRVDTPIVLALNARWGDGKTTFIQMWKHHLAAGGIRTLYFNAWDSDYSSDPLISFIGEMRGQLERENGLDPTRLSEKWTKLKEAGAHIARRALPVAVKVGTAGILDLDTFTEQALGGLGESLAKEKIESYQADKNSVSTFKQRLGEFIRELKGQDLSGKLPVVFFVDELDRCRPTYTVELLERIKHFFDVEGLVFVLSLDKEQLGHSIRSVYGSGLNVNGYLRRFIDLEYQLPKGSEINFAYFLAEQYQLTETLKRIGSPADQRTIDVGLSRFESLASVFNLSLRAQEQCFANLTIALLASRLDIHLSFIMAMLAMRDGNRQMYENFVSSKLTFKELIDAIETSPKGKEFLAGDDGMHFEADLLGWKRGRDRTADEKFAHYNNMASDAQGRSKNAQRARAILMHLGAPFDFYAGAMSYVKALEISGSFLERA